MFFAPYICQLIISCLMPLFILFYCVLLKQYCKVVNVCLLRILTLSFMCCVIYINFLHPISLIYFFRFIKILLIHNICKFKVFDVTIWYAFVVVQLLSCIQLFVTPGTSVCQASLSFTISQSLLRFTSIELVMLSNHLILCWPLFLLPSVFPSKRVFSSESVLCIR